MWQALFNARSVGTPERRCDISTDIDDNAIDLMFLTETRVHSHWDEAKIGDLAPPSRYAVKSFPFKSLSLLLFLLLILDMRMSKSFSFREREREGGGGVDRC